MASMQRARRAVAVGAFLVAAAAAPAIAAVASPDDIAPQAQGPGQCLAWFGARGTGKCIGWADSSAPSWSVGTDGVNTGPLLPGQTFTKSMG